MTMFQTIYSVLLFGLLFTATIGNQIVNGFVTKTTCRIGRNEKLLNKRLHSPLSNVRLRNKISPEEEKDNSLQSSLDDDDVMPQESLPPASSPSSSPMPPTPSFQNYAIAFLAYLAFISIWPLLALLRVKLGGGFGNPVELFDVDKFMTLGLMQQADSATTFGGGVMGGSDEIMELPPLSPAEQLVGAFFGPPR